MRKIYVIQKRPGDEVGQIMEVSSKSEAIQELVGGPIDHIAITNKVSVIVNMYNQMDAKSFNCSVYGINLYGPILVVGEEDGIYFDVPIDLDDWRTMIDG